MAEHAHDRIGVDEQDDLHAPRVPGRHRPSRVNTPANTEEGAPQRNQINAARHRDRMSVSAPAGVARLTCAVTPTTDRRVLDRLTRAIKIERPDDCAGH
jgi:hypothetical protein